MAWDYLDETALPSTRTHYFADSDWEKIGVQLGGKLENYVSLTREEWKRLMQLMAKQDDGCLLDDDLKALSPNLSKVVTDWLRAGWRKPA